MGNGAPHLSQDLFLILFSVSVLDIHLYIQQKSITRAYFPLLSCWECLAWNYSPVQEITSPAWWVSHSCQNLPTDLSVISLCMAKLWLCAFSHLLLLISTSGIALKPIPLSSWDLIGLTAHLEMWIVKCLATSSCGICALIVWNLCWGLPAIIIRAATQRGACGFWLTVD